MAREPWTSVCYEAPSRTAALLADLAKHCGAERPAAVARELTKLHEEVRRGTLGGLEAYYLEHPPRGEVTVVIGGRPDGEVGPSERVGEGALDDVPVDHHRFHRVEHGGVRACQEQRDVVRAGGASSVVVVGAFIHGRPMAASQAVAHHHAAATDAAGR